MDIVAIALRTADKLILQLGFKSARVMEPPFKPVIVLAVKVVDDHVFIRGARDGNRTRTLKEREILSQNMESAPDNSGLGYSLLWQVFRRANAWDHMPVRDANRPGSLSLGS